jgi:hypothetical protein
VEPLILPSAKDVPHVYGLSESLLFAIKLLFYYSHTDHILLPVQSFVLSTTLHHLLLWEDNVVWNEADLMPDKSFVRKHRIVPSHEILLDVFLSGNERQLEVPFSDN